MQSLSQLLESAGCEQVTTYIQSGNVVFKGDVASVEQFGEEVGLAIENEHGFRPAVRLITADYLTTAIASNPYPKAVSEPKTLHLSFLERPPQEELIHDTKRLLSETESLAVVGSLLYLHTPDGIARSRVANRIDRTLQMKTTARNWRTVMKLEELVSTIE